MSDGPNGHPRELLSEYLDDELGLEERAAIDRHLAACEDCRSRLEALRRLAGAIAGESVPPVPVDLEARIGRRLDAATIARPRRWRFVVPTTIAATLGAIGLLVALQWRGERLVAPVSPEPKEKSEIQDRLKPMSAPKTLPAAPEAPVRQREEKESQPEDAIEKDSKRNPVEQNLEQPPEGVPGGVVGGVVGGVEARVAGAVERRPSADDERRDRAMSTVANAPAGLAQPAPAAKAEAVAPCGDLWSDSGVHGAWEVQDAGTAALELARIAHDVGGTGLWRGLDDGRPYRLIVPRDRFEEVFYALRARGVAGLVEPPALGPGSGCAGLSIAFVVPAGLPPPR